MIYPKHKPTVRKTVAVRSMNGGVNLREKPFNIDDGQCSEMHNMWFSNGALKTRPGICLNPENALCDAYTKLALWYDISLFDAGSAPLAASCRLALCRESMLEGVRFRFYMLYPSGAVTQAGSIDFYRTSPTADFYTPRLCSVFYNTSLTGSGIYVMLTLCNYESSERDVRLRFYELGNDLVTWSDVTESKMYVPTIYINGRGNNYGAVVEEPVPSFAPAAFCEPMNMLTGKFRALYGTDGLSHTFKLPFNDLTEREGETVQCRFTYGANDYIWWIAPGKTFSNSVEVAGKNVAVELDRSAGTVIFVNPSDLSYSPLPIASNLGNNLEITAYRSDMTRLEPLNTASVFCEYSSRLFLSGFNTEPNAVFFSTQSNPFYFPSDNILKIGSQSGKITALAKQGKLLIAFKAEECHSIDSRSVSEYDIDSVITGTTDMPAKLSDVRTDILSSEIGCDCPRTLLNCANRLVWLSSNGVIYTIIASNQYSKGNVYELSLNIEPYLKACSKEDMLSAFAVRHGGYYIVFIGKEAVAMDYTIKGFRYVASCSDQKQTSRSIYWYLWRLPEELTWISGITVNGEALLVGCRASDENFWYGTATLSGEQDCIPIGNYGAFSTQKQDIACGLKTKSFDFGTLGCKKFIDRAYLSIGNKKPVSLEVFDHNVKKVRAVISAKAQGEVQIRCVKLKSTALERCALSLESDGYIELCGFELYGGI